MGDHGISCEDMENNNNDHREFVERRIQWLLEGVEVESPLEIPTEPPAWLDKDQFQAGQAVFHDYKLGVLVSNFRSLVLGLAIQNLSVPLALTNRSNTPKRAFRRYMNTGNIIERIYAFEPWNSVQILKTINGYHQDAAKGLRAKSKEERDRLVVQQFEALPPEPYNLKKSEIAMLSELQKVELSDDLPEIITKLLTVYTQSGVVFSQTDMALVHLAFFSSFIQHPKMYGGIGVQPCQFEAFLHFWRVTGYYLGVKDEHNLAGGGSIEELKATWTVIFDGFILPQICKLDGVALKMTKAVSEGHNMSLSLVVYSELMDFGVELVDLWKQLPFSNKCTYYTRRFVMEWIYVRPWFRSAINSLTTYFSGQILHRIQRKE